MDGWRLEVWERKIGRWSIEVELVVSSVFISVLCFFLFSLTLFFAYLAFRQLSCRRLVLHSMGVLGVGSHMIPSAVTCVRRNKISKTTQCHVGDPVCYFHEQ